MCVSRYFFLTSQTMKAIIHKSLAVFMAGVVLFTTMSFAVDVHFCGETLVDYSFFQKVDTCGMEDISETSTCESPTLSEKTCCKDQQFLKQGQEDLKLSMEKLSLGQQIFVASFTYSYIGLFEATQSTAVPFVAYPPPFIERDLQVLHQTFLI